MFVICIPPLIGEYLSEVYALANTQYIEKLHGFVNYSTQAVFHFFQTVAKHRSLLNNSLLRQNVAKYPRNRSIPVNIGKVFTFFSSRRLASFCSV